MKVIMDRQFLRQNRVRGLILFILLGIGMVTPLQEFTRCAMAMSTGEELVYDPVHSFSDIQTDDTEIIRLIDSQFMSHDYRNKSFFRIFGRQDDK